MVLEDGDGDDDGGGDGIGMGMGMEMGMEILQCESLEAAGDTVVVLEEAAALLSSYWRNVVPPRWRCPWQQMWPIATEDS